MKGIERGLVWLKFGKRVYIIRGYVRYVMRLDIIWRRMKSYLDILSRGVIWFNYILERLFWCFV